MTQLLSQWREPVKSVTFEHRVLICPHQFNQLSMEQRPGPGLGPLGSELSPGQNRLSRCHKLQGAAEMLHMLRGGGAEQVWWVRMSLRRLL